VVDMERKKQYRLRVENCIGTIIDVQKKVNYPLGNQKILSQFEELKKAVSHMDMSQVSETDVSMIEQATNALLGEFKSVFESKDDDPVGEKERH